MTMATCASLANYLDQLLGVAQHPDYPNALNGLQFANNGTIGRIGAAVDFSLEIVQKSRASNIDFLIVHHGMFWGGLQRVVGAAHDRIRALVEANLAVYAAHLPLDSHSELGNAALLARQLGLQPNGGFAQYSNVYVGVRGESDIATSDLIESLTRFAAEHGSVVRASDNPTRQRTKRWAICTGSGASTETLRSAGQEGIDTLIVGEGPHHTAVEARELGITVIYAGHYATETLGVQAIAERAAAEYRIPWQFLSAPTGL